MLPTLRQPEGERVFLTRKILHSYKNIETVELKELLCQLGKYDISTYTRENKEKRMFLCPKGEAFNTTFIRYNRLDGKPEETRIDKVIEVSHSTAHSKLFNNL